MAIPRFYIDIDLAVGQTVLLTDLVLRHLHVLRRDIKDTLTLFNGQGGEYHGELLSIGKRMAEVKITAFDSISRASPLNLTLVQALSKADRMDYTIQKATECGVQQIQPIISARSQSSLQGMRADKKLSHWRAVAISACEQCGRNDVPVILPIQSFAEYLRTRKVTDLNLLLSPTGATSINVLPLKANHIHVLIGPEGGFDAHEERQAIAAGFIPLMLGPRIFRTETVAPVIASLLQHRYGDFS